jgi:two-component system sensor histidine kinase/response regulator
VPQLDVDRGLSLSNHNTRLYVSLLGKFVQSQEQAVHQVRAALAQADVPSAERVAHTLKGVAASLGAQALSAAGAALEQALHRAADTPQLEHLCAQTQTQLEALVIGLRGTPGFLTDATPTASRSLSDAERAAVLPTIEALRQLLAQDDAESQALWETHSVGLHAVLKQADAVEQAIQDFDFEKALQLLEQTG